VEEAATSVAHRAALGASVLACPRRTSPLSRTADVGLAAAAAGLSGHGAGTTIDGTTAAIADRSAVCALLLAGERVAGTGSALIRALRTANLTLRARAALNDLSASIGDRTALGIEVAAILRLAGIT